MDKSELRQVYLAARRRLSPEEAAARSSAIKTRLLQMSEFAVPRPVLSYVAALENEVDTTPLIAELLSQGRRVLVPVMAKGRTLRWSRLESLEELTPNRFGVPEPLPQFMRTESPPCDAVAIVPGLIFTPEGHRVGFGGGYYDRFLAGFGGFKAGVAYDCQLADAIPVEPHDVAVDCVVTESTVYWRKTPGLSR